jgi:protein transport protein SEC20
MLMQSELSRSQFAHDTLKESTAALSQLSEQYSTLDTLLSSSRNLLSTLLRSQKSDTWYLETAFYVLVATIVWLVFRRFLYGPMWWFVWLPLKMFYKAWMGVFTAVGLRSSRDGVFASSSVGTTVLPESVLATPSISYSSPMATTSDPPPAHGEGSLLEEVGNMVDASRQQGEEGGPEQNPAPAEPEQPPRDPPPNPKKRMWEEPPPPPKAEAERKDEL